MNTSSNWFAIVVAVLAGLTPFVMGEQIQEYFNLSENGLGIVRGVVSILGIVVTAYNGLQIQKKS